MNDIVQLGFAVAIAGSVVSYLVWAARQNQRFLQRLVENHLAHQTTALLKLEVALVNLTAWLKRTTK